MLLPAHLPAAVNLANAHTETLECSPVSNANALHTHTKSMHARARASAPTRAPTERTHTLTRACAVAHRPRTPTRQVSRLMHHSRRTEEDDGGPPDGGSGADQRLSWSAHGLRDTTGRTGTYRYMAPEVWGTWMAHARRRAQGRGGARKVGTTWTLMGSWTRLSGSGRLHCPTQAGPRIALREPVEPRCRRGFGEEACRPRGECPKPSSRRGPKRAKLWMPSAKLVTRAHIGCARRRARVGRCPAGPAARLPPCPRPGLGGPAWSLSDELRMRGRWARRGRGKVPAAEPCDCAQAAVGAPAPDATRAARSPQRPRGCHSTITPHNQARALCASACVCARAVFAELG